LPWWWRQYAPLKRRSTSTWLHPRRLQNFKSDFSLHNFARTNIFNEFRIEDYFVLKKRGGGINASKNSIGA
jgi:hypothetical protein